MTSSETLLMAFPHLDVYLAGGVVRDSLLGRNASPRDFDFFLSGDDMDSTLERLGKQGLLTVGPFGSPRWHSNEDGQYCEEPFRVRSSCLTDPAP